ncbi:hypothetical protein, partial [Streptomyces odonnellii]
PDEVTLDVRDSGGKGPAGLGASGSGYGLLGMRERAELLGGSLEAGPRGLRGAGPGHAGGPGEPEHLEGPEGPEGSGRSERLQEREGPKDSPGLEDPRGKGFTVRLRVPA